MKRYDWAFLLGHKLTVGDLLTENGLTVFRDFAYKFKDLRRILEKDASFVTVFAPTNEAFFGLSEAETAKMESNENYLRQVLKHHISPGDHVTSKQGYTELQSMANYPVILRSYGGVRLYY